MNIGIRKHYTTLFIAKNHNMSQNHWGLPFIWDLKAFYTFFAYRLNNFQISKTASEKFLNICQVITNCIMEISWTSESLYKHTVIELPCLLLRVKSHFCGREVERRLKCCCRVSSFLLFTANDSADYPQCFAACRRRCFIYSCKSCVDFSAHCWEINCCCRQTVKNAAQTQRKRFESSRKAWGNPFYWLIFGI